MKIARYQLHDAVHYGVLEGEHLERLSGSPFDGITPVGPTDALADAKLLCPLAAFSAIRCRNVAAVIPARRKCNKAWAPA